MSSPGKTAGWVCALALAAALALVPGAGAHRSVDGTLNVTFGQDGMSITLALPDGTPVTSTTTIPAGTYAVVINNPYRDDLSIIHLFHLTGPGVLILTDLNAGEESQDVYPAVFQPNTTYSWQDDNHPAVHGSFRTSATVTATPAAPTTTSAAVTATAGASTSNVDVAGSSANALPLRGTLETSVVANGAASLFRAGVPVKRLAAGRYTIVVGDNDPRGGFLLRASGAAKPLVTTANAYLGRRSFAVALRVGRWVYAATPTGKFHSFLVVSK